MDIGVERRQIAAPAEWPPWACISSLRQMRRDFEREGIVIFRRAGSQVEPRIAKTASLIASKPSRPVTFAAHARKPGDVALSTATTSTDETSRRDFLYVATGSVAAVGAVSVVWPLISQMSPDASTLVLASTEVDIGAIPAGQIVTVKWRGKPVFIRHRTPDEIKAAVDADNASMPDPVPDALRAQKPEWLVVIGICTHLGCIPLGNQGDYNGWFCPCHGSVYDTAGRIRKGPAPRNLDLPPYAFMTDTKVKIG